MRQRLSSVLIAIALAGVCASPASAANKEHQQLMADLRMLQEQSQVLQNLLGTLTESLKARWSCAYFDQQAEATVKRSLIKLRGRNRLMVSASSRRMGEQQRPHQYVTQEVDSVAPGRCSKMNLARPAGYIRPRSGERAGCWRSGRGDARQCRCGSADAVAQRLPTRCGRASPVHRRSVRSGGEGPPTSTPFRRPNGCPLHRC